MTNGEVILKLIKDITGIELELGEEFNVNSNILKVTCKCVTFIFCLISIYSQKKKHFVVLLL